MFFGKEYERPGSLFFRNRLFLHTSILSLFPNSLQSYLIRGYWVGQTLLSVQYDMPQHNWTGRSACPTKTWQRVN
jgi:hypothetical protein